MICASLPCLLQQNRGEAAKRTLHKIIVLGRESLDQIEDFEENVTGRKLIHTKINNSSKKLNVSYLTYFYLINQLIRSHISF